MYLVLLRSLSQDLAILYRKCAKTDTYAADSAQGSREKTKGSSFKRNWKVGSIVECPVRRPVQGDHQQSSRHRTS
ncbi:hypothetical protein MTO96_045776 [Rhipicephalus appendiculatus]